MSAQLTSKTATNCVRQGCPEKETRDRLRLLDQENHGRRKYAHSTYQSTCKKPYVDLKLQQYWEAYNSLTRRCKRQYHNRKVRKIAVINKQAADVNKQAAAVDSVTQWKENRLKLYATGFKAHPLQEKDLAHPAASNGPTKKQRRIRPQPDPHT